jgi:DNA mismatch endonuclease (patch repair protein)
VLTRARIAILIHGCFWHACTQHATHPASNSAWWSSKLAKNVERDRDTERRLREAGWEVVIIWEHDDPGQAAAEIQRLVERRSI